MKKDEKQCIYCEASSRASLFLTWDGGVSWFQYQISGPGLVEDKAGAAAIAGTAEHPLGADQGG